MSRARGARGRLDVHPPGPALVLGQRRPEGGPVGDDGARVAAACHALAHRPASLADHVVDGPLDGGRRRRRAGLASAGSRRPSASSRSAVSGVRSRWDRSATDSRSASRSSSMRLAEGVDGPADVAHLRPARRARRAPSGSPSDRRRAAAARAVTGRTVPRASRSATSTASSSRPAPSPTSTVTAGRTPLRSSASGDEGAHDGPPALRCRRGRAPRDPRRCRP